jgi:hypothetical protein
VIERFVLYLETADTRRILVPSGVYPREREGALAAPPAAGQEA